MNKNLTFRIELWRIVKFLLINMAVSVILGLASGPILNAIMSTLNGSTGLWLSIHSYAHILLSATILTLVHRYFTFRAPEPWYIALPIMLVFALAWQWLSHLPMVFAARTGTEALIAIRNLLDYAAMSLQSLLQRCVSDGHTTDTNGWYRRFHLTNDEKECVSHE